MSSFRLPARFSLFALCAGVAACGGRYGLESLDEPWADAGAPANDAAAAAETTTEAAADAAPEGTPLAEGGLETPLAAGLSVTRVVVTQSVSIAIAEDGASVGADDRNAPVVASRPALLRAFVKPAADWTARKVTAVLELARPGAPAVVRQVTLNPPFLTTETNSKAGFNFDLDAADVTEDLSVAVSLHELSTQPVQALPTAGARWPATGHAPLVARPTGGPLRLTIVPFAYKADGSGRLPDTSPARVEDFRRRFFVAYPVAEVKIDVRAPADFDLAIDADGTGWNEFLQATCKLRKADAPDPKVYYLGLILPADDFGEYCAGGCVAGIAPLTKNSADTFGRCATSLGYGGQMTLNTALHEIGHAMGRGHAPCGTAKDVDPDFPYSGGGIGVVGFDLLARALKPTGQYRDVMGYCDPRWLSDYTYRALSTRLAVVNGVQQPYVVGPTGGPRAWRMVGVGPTGEARWGERVVLDAPPLGEPVAVTLIDAAGRAVGRETASFHATADVPGGILLLPDPGPGRVRAVVLPGGKRVEVTR